jgi:hypothetical protein
LSNVFTSSTDWARTCLLSIAIWDGPRAFINQVFNRPSMATSARSVARMHERC